MNEDPNVRILRIGWARPATWRDWPAAIGLIAVVVGAIALILVVASTVLVVAIVVAALAVLVGLVSYLLGRFDIRRPTRDRKRIENASD